MASSVWYHGTWRENIESIIAGGLTAAYYGTDYQGFGVPYHVLGRDKHQARLADRDVAVVLAIPEDNLPNT